MAKTFTLKVPTSHTPFYAPFTPFKADFGICTNFLKIRNASKFGREKCKRHTIFNPREAFH